ncbi:Hypp2601 [Branchiostoma lanceolatum]|uniref:Hypp2601 protein n=1 Tax=Branchiostoma lanceolatum TaxID=7740 RepID=A0A8J9ZSU5_BRALA|nr:Hypp2601 [Branchiostoma lanceolatum]
MNACLHPEWICTAGRRESVNCCSKVVTRWSHIDLDLLGYASQNNSSPNVLYRAADVSDVSTFKPEWHGAFSKAVCLMVLHWVQDKAEAVKAIHSCVKSRGEILLGCVAEESRFYQTSQKMASHPKWRIYLKDFVPNLFPWPSSDLTNERHSSRLLEECGFEVLSCHIKEHQQPFESREKLKESLRAVFPHLHYIPQDKHDEFFDDLFEMAKDIHLISTDYTAGTNNTLVLHARKL